MIIGLSGYAQSGKDTVANILVDQYGFTRVAFADKIREFLYESGPDYLKCLVDEVGWENAKQHKKVREMLQNTGVGARKVFGDDFWVYQAMGSIASAHSNIVVTDVRFLNEANIIKENGGQIWRIKRFGVDAVNAHISETEMDDYKVNQIFVNNGTLDDLSALVRARMAGLLV